MIGFDFTTTYEDHEIRHVVKFFAPCKMRASIVEDAALGGCRITYQRGSKHGRRYEYARDFESARRRVTAWVRRNESEWSQ